MSRIELISGWVEGWMGGSVGSRPRCDSEEVTIGYAISPWYNLV